MKKSTLFLSAVVAFSVGLQAKDLGFRFKNGKCVNEAGAQGYNTGYLGQCSDLRGVIMSRFVLDDMDLQGCLFDSADLQNTSMKRTNLSHISARQANFSGVDFEGAILHESDFTQSLLNQSHLRKADILNLNLTGADLSDSQLSYFKCAGCTVAGIKLARAEMDSSDLRGMDFSGADLTETNLQKAMLDGVKFNGATLQRASFIMSSLVGVSAAKSKMRGAIFRQANMKGANLESCEAGSAQFDNANLDNANFKKAMLNGAVFTGASVRGADFSGAKYNKRTVLPFAEDEAVKRGMVIGGGSIYVLWDTDQTSYGLPALLKYLETQGIEVKLSAGGHTAFDGTDDFKQYDAVFHMYGEGYNTNLSAGAQSALNRYVRDGGIYIATAWSGFGVQFSSLFENMHDLIFIPYDSFAEGELKFMPTVGMESDPLLAGIQFPMTLRTYVSIGTRFLPPGTANLADPKAVLVDANKNIIGAVREIGNGKVVNFAFVPESGNDVLNQLPAQQLILNAIQL